MKRTEYIEKYPYGTECSFTDEYIEEQVKKLRDKLFSKKGEILIKNFRTRKVRVSC